MEYYEIAFEIVLKENIECKNFNDKISSGINYCLTNNMYTRDIHKNTNFKLYTFYIKELCPLKFGQKVTLIIRAMTNDLIKNLKDSIYLKNNDIFVATQIIYEIKKEYNSFNKILAVKTIMPAILTIKKEYKNEKNKYMDIKSFNKKLTIDRINGNLQKKYKQLTGKEIECDCIDDILLLNDKSYVCSYKEGFIIGNKYLIIFKKDILSQKIAILAMGSGILEKNSLGFGVCFANNDYLYQHKKEE